ncbi:ABC transporter ATP-binding protein [Planotetraspora thailandica]|uniref:ABC transporter ATP-binding protein n=1 Tax=Planotetraspora thailandica TaxID=487172 RepID=A0A8J3XZF3_9ACTN|nr:ABC transporter ATP-binding protein [Planotetraspora thailandica]
MIVVSNLSFSWPDGTSVFEDLSFSVPAGRTGLVAPNGAGKSTLLRLIAGALRPASGSVAVEGAPGYLPQTLPLADDVTVAEMLEVAPVIAALHAIESGDVSEDHFTTVGSDWDIEERARAVLDRLGLTDVALDRTTRTLSGGQVISLGLAAQLLKRPDVLLLDEPTNNLDLEARHRLYEVLQDYKGALLLVSHDRMLLDRMDRIAELGGGELRFYGGNFTEYETAVREAREVAEKNVRNAEQELRREKREAQQARERAQRRAGNAARNLKSAGLSRLHAGNHQRRAQESAGKSAEVHGQRLDAAKARLDQAEQALRDDQRISLSLPETSVPAGRMVLVGAGMRVRQGDRQIFAGDGADLTIRGPERIALTGRNGAGKSTLLRLISGDLALEAGSLTRGQGRVAYLSQRLDLLDLGRSTADNLRAFAPNLRDAQVMHVLARFLFRGSRAQLPVGALSGGERLRATLACLLYAEPAPQLLLLDEPTNNLDLVSVAQLEGALQSYEGAFVVVSHDERFLREIGVDRWLRLSEGRLLETAAPDA